MFPGHPALPVGLSVPCPLIYTVWCTLLFPFPLPFKICGRYSVENQRLVWEKSVLLHPLSGTEAALLGSFEKKLGEKFGSKVRKSLSLRPLSAKRGAL